ncbi:winged helix DNA-binding protein [Sphingomonas morindae]|uniref:Winged helix DNA-binding protein n=1 Tax=Sphingomonas morindae TaxID=1541170 RepID=A0ABY4X9T5_9SPHN|nr:winged helix DNA-binding protein [Sphingomonas morindae]USI73708.1 winged helix DNA-binding protein [Sphingomonas morindae]
MDRRVVDLLYERKSGMRTLLLGDNAKRMATLHAAVLEAGGEVIGQATIAEALLQLEDAEQPELVIVDVQADYGALLDAALARLERAAQERRFEALVLVPLALVDLASTQAGLSASLLVDPEPREMASALVAACRRRSTEVHDSSAEAMAMRLADLSEEVGRVARSLAQLVVPGATPGVLEEVPPAEEMALLRAVIRRRRLRHDFFVRGLFADAAWDMLLDLRLAQLERREVAVSSLCIAASVPATTALRWISTLIDNRLMVRHPDPRDRRRAFVSLTPAANQAMAAYAGAVLRQSAELTLPEDLSPKR